MQIFLLILIIQGSICDWASDWLTPLEYQYKQILTQNRKNDTPKNIADENDPEMFNLDRYIQLHKVTTKSTHFISSKEKQVSSLKTKLEETLRIAKTLTTILSNQIQIIENQERLLKEAIVNGRSGVTTLTVSTLGQAPRTYIIRDGYWTLCNGMVQYPPSQITYNVFTELFSVPRCIGQEVTSKRDTCVFNSIIKYETIPASMNSTYFEDNYLCLKASFNNTLEYYMSVPKRVVDETCKDGVIRNIADNVLDCGVRILSEYTYYPQRSDLNSILPLEYCTEKDGSCKLFIAWHLSNRTIENFEFLKIDQNFKKFFMKVESYLEPFL